MAVKRIPPKGAKPTPTQSTPAVVRTAALPARTICQLPTETKGVQTDLSNYTFLLYGQPKIGKTSVLATFPDALFLCTEPGAKGLDIFEYKAGEGGCATWQDLLDVAELLAATNRFKYVVVDTVDKAYEMCLDYVCAKLHIAYPGVDEFGENDWGKSWKEVRKEFTRFVDTLTRMNRGVAFTSHAQSLEIKSKQGSTYSTIVPSMGKQARTTIEALVDFFLYCDYIKTSEGIERVFITEGDETVWAGHRAPAKFPRFVPMDAEVGYAILESAFRGEAPELKLDNLQVSTSSLAAFKKYIRNIRQSCLKKPNTLERSK